MSFLGRIYEGEEGYLELVDIVLRNGVPTSDRTGVGTIAMFDAKLVIREGFPFSTIRPAPLRMAFEEFWMFLRGETQTKVLEEKGINFWKGNTSREFLDKRGLEYLEEGDMGKAYGSQWRNYGKTTSYDPYQAADQFKQVQEELATNPHSRRLYTTFWNPNESHLMALTPCWYAHQFVVIDNTLHMKVLNRSVDLIFGSSYASMQYRLYQMATAKLHGFELGTMSCDFSQVHIYNNQIPYAKEMLTRQLGKQGTVEITKELRKPRDIVEMVWEDIKVDGLEVNKEPFVTPRPPMAV